MIEIVGVILFNHSDKEFPVQVGDRIAQLIIEKITDTKIVEVDELDETNRGAGGFGSTGVSGEVQHNHGNSDKEIMKRKSPEGGFLGRDILMKAGTINVEEDCQWKEWSILVLYSLCESELITVNQKKVWGKAVFDGNRKAFEHLKDYSQSGDLNVLKKQMENI